MASDDLNRRAAEAMGWEKFFPEWDNIIHWVWKGTTALTGYCFNSHPDSDIGTKVEHFDPCNRIEHAWMLVEWAIKSEKIRVIDFSVAWNGYKWFASFKAYSEENFITDTTAPLAITCAFLEAVGDSE